MNPAHGKIPMFLIAAGLPAARRGVMSEVRPAVAPLPLNYGGVQVPEAKGWEEGIEMAELYSLPHPTLSRRRGLRPTAFPLSALPSIAKRHSAQLDPPDVCSISITWSRLKLAAFWRGGNSLKVCRNLPTYVCAGTSRKT